MSKNIYFPTLYRRQLVAIAIPMAVSQAAIALMQTADTLMVAPLGTEALAAITPAGLAVMVISVFGTGVLTAVSTQIGNANGRGDSERCAALGWQGIWCAITLGLFALAFIPTASELFRAFGHSPEIRKLEESYFRISVVGILPQLIGIVIANYFIATLRPKLAMLGTLVAISVNLVANLALVGGRWGLPALGIAGAAWGTVIASTCYALLMLCLFLKLSRRHCRRSAPRRQAIGKLLKQGAPIGVQDTVDAMSWGIVLVVLVGRFGAEHLAAASVLIRCMQVSFLPADGVGVGLLALVANAIGAGNPRQARVQTNVALRLCSVYMASVAIILYLFRGQILDMFSDDPEVIEIGSRAMVCVALFQVFDAMAITHVNALFGAGDTAWPSWLNVFLGVVVLLGGGILLSHLFPHLESMAIWLATTLFIMLQGILLYRRWIAGKWEHLKPPSALVDS